MLDKITFAHERIQLFLYIIIVCVHVVSFVYRLAETSRLMFALTHTPYEGKFESNSPS